MPTQKAVKFRLYPTEQQKAELAKQFGHARFVYNAALELRKDMYFADKTRLSYEDTANALSEFKRNNPDLVWLNEASAQVLQQSLKDLDKAYKRFFDMHKKGTLPKSKPGEKPRKDGMPKGYPKNKTKHDDQSIRFPQDVRIGDNAVILPKVGAVPAVLHRAIVGKINSATVSKTKSGKYFVSLQCEIQDKPVTPADGEIGIDLGLKDFAILSNGEKIASPKPLRKVLRRLKIRQRRLSRKLEAKKDNGLWINRNKGEKSIRKASKAIAATHEKITNRRKDFHHKLSRQLVNRFGLIALEDLNVKGMMQNGNVALAVADAGWSQFVNFLTYKQAWAGGEIFHVDRFFPSSKLCSCCGSKNQLLKRSDRSWVCPDCGAIHDRDINAAVNILNQATVGTTESGNTVTNAVGHMSQPVRNSAPESIGFKQLPLFELEAQAL